MASYLLRRLALTIPILLGVSLLVFLMLHSAGGDPAQSILGARADPESIAQLRQDLGLDRPLLVQYAAFLGGAVRGDFGRSYRSNTPVIAEIAARFPATIELAIAAMAIAVVTGVVFGTLAAVRRHSLLDYVSSTVVLLGVSIPTFWLGLILIIIFGLWMRWLPISGRVDPRLGADPSLPFLTLASVLHGNWAVAKDALRPPTLPALTRAAWPAAIVARMTRASLIESLGQDYVRTARGKGLPEQLIVVGHAARNALLPVLTVVGLEFGTLLGGAVVTETIFSWPGLGQLTVAAIGARDYQMVQGVVVLLAALVAIATIGPFLVRDPVVQNIQDRLTPPNATYWFGTDDLGRDIFARVVSGAPISLVSGLASVVIGLALGTLVGTVAGYVEGRGGLVLMAAMDLLLALPAILLAITVAARVGAGLPAAMVAAGLVGLPAYARLSRASTLAVKRREMVDAARAIGATDREIVVRHIVPNILTPLIVQSTIGVGNAILLVSALGFLGLGAQAPTPEWGRMLSDAQRYVTDSPFIGIFQGLAISLTVLGFNLTGDGLRDALDPTFGR